MGAKIGSGNVSFRLGSATPVKLAIGATDAWTSGPTLPGAPESPSLGVSGPSELTLQWSPPANDGGAAITGYAISYTITSGVNAGQTATDTVGVEAGTQYVITSAQVNGTEYSATVAAINSVGTGPATSPVTASTADVPGAPSWMSASASMSSQGAIEVAFLAPMSNGGSAVTMYQLEYDTGEYFSTASSVSFPDTTYTLTGLTGGQAYYLRIRAQNAAGSGEWATFGSNPVTPSDTVPSVPTSFAVSPDYANNEWDTTWTEASDGGSTITQYEIQESDEDFLTTATQTKSGTGASYSYAVATPDANRKFRIRATNTVGSSEWSEWVTAYYDTPTVPGAGAVTSAVYQQGQTIVDWTYPADDGNSSITTITVYIDGVAQTPASILSGTHIFNADYTGQEATVSFTNAVGEGPQSAAVEVQPE
jgi:titin